MPSNDVTLYAKYEQENPSKLPILTEGKITAQMLYRFEKGCQRYFFVKGVSRDVNQIAYTMTRLRDPAISTWIDSNNERLMKLSFADFMTELRRQALDTDWETDIRREMILSKYSLSKDFQNWADYIIFLNCILQSTDKHYDDRGLLGLLQANLDTNLDREVRAPRSQVRTDSLKNWVEDVRRLAEAERRNIKRARELAEDAYQRSTKRQAIASLSAIKPRRFENTTNSVIKWPSPPDRVPPLTSDERALLNEHKGCRRCRKFYVEHIAKDCKNGFPDAKTYKTLRVEMALAAKQKKEARGN